MLFYFHMIRKNASGCVVVVTRTPQSGEALTMSDCTESDSTLIYIICNTTPCDVVMLLHFAEYD